MAKVELELTKTDGTKYTINRFNGLKSVESTSQSTPDASSISYGVLANTGSAEIVDVDGAIKDMIANDEIRPSNVETKLYANGKQVQSHITNDSNYTNDKTFSIALTDRLSIWDSMQYNGYAYPNESRTAYQMLYSVLGDIGETNIDDMLNTNIVYGDGETQRQGTVKQYLQAISIQYPYLGTDTVRNTIEKFCRLAQLQVYQTDDGQIKFVSARPIITASQSEEAINIPISNQFSQLDKSVILKNKFDAVEIQEKQVGDVIDYNAVVHSQIVIDNLTSYIQTKDGGQSKTYAFSSYNLLQGQYENVVRGTYSYIENYYVAGSFSFSASSTDGLENIEDVYSYVNGGLKFSVTYNKKTKTSTKMYSTSSGTITDDNFTYDFSLVDWDSGTSIIETSSEIPISISATANVSDVNTSVSLTKSNSFTVLYDDVNNEYTINYTLLVGSATYSAYQNTNTYYTSSQQTTFSILPYGTATMYEPLEINISIYGDKRTISFKDISASDDTTNAKGIVTIQNSELLQTGTLYDNSTKMSDIIKSNIKSDYANGVSNATITVGCANYYDNNNVIKKDWSNGQIIETHDNIVIKGDGSIWRTTGRKFRHSGVPYCDLELQEIKSIYEPPKYSVTFPSSVSAYVNGQSVTSGTQLEEGTEVRIYTSKSNLIYLRANGEDISNNSTITLSNDTTITISYKQKYSSSLNYFTLPTDSSTQRTTFNADDYEVASLYIQNRYQIADVGYWGTIEQDFTYPLTETPQTVNYLRVWQEDGYNQSEVVGTVSATNTYFEMSGFTKMYGVQGRYDYEYYQIVTE